MQVIRRYFYLGELNIPGMQRIFSIDREKIEFNCCYEKLDEKKFATSSDRVGSSSSVVVLAGIDRYRGISHGENKYKKVYNI